MVQVTYIHVYLSFKKILKLQTINMSSVLYYLLDLLKMIQLVTLN